MKITNTTSNDIDSNQYVCVCVDGWMDKGACRPPYT